MATVKATQEGGRTPPEKIGKVGRVVVVYRAGKRGLPMVQYMSEFGFNRLKELVDAFEGLVRVRDQLASHPNRAVRKQMSDLLNLNITEEPIEETPPTPYEFSIYEVKGLRTKRAESTARRATLIPLDIKEVRFIDVVTVSN